MKRRAIYITAYQASTLLTVVDRSLGSDYELNHAMGMSGFDENSMRRDVRIAWVDLRPALIRIAASDADEHTEVDRAALAGEGEKDA